MERSAAANVIQQWALRRMARHRLWERFRRCRARLDFDEDNRRQLIASVLVHTRTSWTLRQCSGLEDYQALGKAVEPDKVIAQMRLRRSLASSLSSSEKIRKGDPSREEREDVAVWAELERAAAELEAVQTKAIVTLQQLWRHTQWMQVLEQKFRARATILMLERQHRAVSMMKRGWKASRLRREMATRVRRTREERERREDIAVRQIQVLCRRRRGAKELETRFAVRKIILAEATLREMNAAANKIQLWYRRRMDMYFTIIRIVARHQQALKV
ncbi:unnamed protein product [Choristocarpus tenellus]